MKKIIPILLLMLMFTACGSTSLKSLPKAEPDSKNQFGVDKNITIENIDDYLNRDDSVYRDMRLLYDPAEYSKIGGDADLSFSINGFKVTPYPYLGTLQVLPVDGAYSGKCLYTVVWNDDGSVKSATPNYKESELILSELFPKDKNIFLTCGGGGYAGMTRTLLIFLGWDESKLYNIGGAWEYKGDNKFEILVYPEDANDDSFLATWRADYAFIDFEKLHPLGETK